MKRYRNDTDGHRRLVAVDPTTGVEGFVVTFTTRGRPGFRGRPGAVGLAQSVAARAARKFPQATIRYEVTSVYHAGLLLKEATQPDWTDWISTVRLTSGLRVGFDSEDQVSFVTATPTAADGNSP